MQASRHLRGSSCHRNGFWLSWLHIGADSCILCPQWLWCCVTCVQQEAVNAAGKLFSNSCFFFVIAAMKRVEVSHLLFVYIYSPLELFICRLNMFWFACQRHLYVFPPAHTSLTVKECGHGNSFSNICVRESFFF